MSAKWTYPAVRKGKQTGDTNRRPTRNDVAALAGVSTAVVSYVMNDGPRTVAPATRQRVLDAVRELDYQPNDAARSLRTQSTHTIALISHALQSSHFGTLTTSITERLAEQSYVATVSTLDDNSDPTPPVVQRLIAKRVDGVALSAQVASPQLLALLKQEGVPAIVIGARVADATSVLVDPAAIRQVAAEHLHALGHERIALLHRQTSADQPAFPSDMTIETNDTIEAGIEAANHLIGLDQRPTAVIVESELVALGAIDALKRSGLAIPDDISVIGLDDLDLGRHLTPSLTAVPSLGPEVGSAAAQVLLQKINGEPTPDVIEVVPVVIERESTAPASP